MSTTSPEIALPRRRGKEAARAAAKETSEVVAKGTARAAARAAARATTRFPADLLAADATDVERLVKELNTVLEICNVGEAPKKLEPMKLPIKRFISLNPFAPSQEDEGTEHCSVMCTVMCTVADANTA